VVRTADEAWPRPPLGTRFCMSRVGRSSVRLVRRIATGKIGEGCLPQRRQTFHVGREPRKFLLIRPLARFRGFRVSSIARRLSTHMGKMGPVRAPGAWNPSEFLMRNSEVGVRPMEPLHTGPKGAGQVAEFCDRDGGRRPEVLCQGP
jgi:hypothetical protein